MNIAELKGRAAALKQLAAVGEKIIVQFKDYARENLADELALEEDVSPFILRVRFYGLSFLLRVELRLRENTAEGAVVAYRLSYNPVRSEYFLNVSYAFDKQGNMRGGTQRSAALPYTECAPRFFADVFTQLAIQDDAVLRP